MGTPHKQQKLKRPIEIDKAVARLTDGVPKLNHKRVLLVLANVNELLKKHQKGTHRFAKIHIKYGSNGTIINSNTIENSLKSYSLTTTISWRKNCTSFEMVTVLSYFVMTWPL